MNRTDLEKAARVVAAGGIVAYPTESCYGLGCDPRQHRAVRRLLRLKGRSRQMGLILIAAHLRQLENYFHCADGEVLEKLSADWPGPHTWLLPARPHVSPWLRGKHEKIALRVTAHAGAARLCRYARSALVSTSANRHTRPAALSAKAVYREFGDRIDYLLEGRLGGMENPSQIRDAISNELVRS